MFQPAWAARGRVSTGHPGALLVIFLLETSKIILHCHQSGDDNIAAYDLYTAERQVKQIVEPNAYL